MQVGDLVKLNTENSHRPEAFKAVGVVLQVVAAGGHRENASYEVMWSNEIRQRPYAPPGRIGWHTSINLVGVK